MNVSSDARGNDGSFNVEASKHNLFGRLESATLSYTKGTRIADGLSLLLHKPIIGARGKTSDVMLEVGKQNAASRTGGFNTSDLQTNLKYKMRLLGGLATTEVGALWQQILGDGPVSVKVREEYGHHVKCGVRCSYERDGRDDNILPTRGDYTRISTEAAGFLGDAHHLKVDCQVQRVRRLPILGYTGSLTLRAGLLHSKSKSWITDRFFVGGPGSVRGFYEDGISRPVGGTCHWGAGLSLYRGLPFSPYIWGLGPHIRLHHFVNAGNLVGSAGEVFEKCRVSVGSGVIVKVGSVMKMEVNYAVPVRFQPGDAVNHGLQFGIGVNFM